MLGDVQSVTEPTSRPSGLGEAGLLALFEAAPVPMLVLDPGLTIVCVTDSYLRVLRTKRELLVGRPLFEVYPDDADDANAHAVRNLRRSLERVLREGVPDSMEPQRYDLMLSTDAGPRLEEHWWTPSNSPVFERDGTLRWIVHRVEDITERLRAERALRESEAHLREVERRGLQEQLDHERSVFNRFFTQSHDLMCIADRQGVFRRVNPAAQALGWRHETLAGRALLSFVHPDEQGSVQAMLQPLAGGRTGVEARFRCEDGSYRWLSWSAARDEAGMLYATARDVTESRQANDDLRRAKTLAESANRELESFCYTVAHDLRAPLRSMDGFSQALLEDYREQLDEPGKTYLTRLRAGAQRMALLIDDLLALSRLSRGELASQRVDLSALALSVFEQLRDREPQRQVAVHVETELHAQGDANLLLNALENLIGNAWKFTRDRADARIEIGQQRIDGERTFFVRDNGAGFDMAYASKLFGAFQRLHAVREFEGTGIGLASVQRIIGRHGGRIWPRAEVGRGATFYFTLPWQERP